MVLNYLRLNLLNVLLQVAYKHRCIHHGGLGDCQIFHGGFTDDGLENKCPLLTSLLHTTISKVLYCVYSISITPTPVITKCICRHNRTANSGLQQFDDVVLSCVVQRASVAN